MAFKINLSHNGKATKFETENEDLVGITIGDSVEGKEISADLEGYELEVTGTSDKAGFPGFKEHAGPQLRTALLKKGKGMHDTRKGVRIRKTIRGNTISLDTVQINMSVKKQGSKKFDEFVKKPETAAK